jgi:hypothetical protein
MKNIFLGLLTVVCLYSCAGIKAGVVEKNCFFSSSKYYFVAKPIKKSQHKKQELSSQQKNSIKTGFDKTDFRKDFCCFHNEYKKCC